MFTPIIVKNKIAHDERVKNWHKNNPEAQKRIATSDKSKASQRKWYINPLNKKKMCNQIRDRRRERYAPTYSRCHYYYSCHQIRDRRRERYATDPLFRLTICVRDMMRRAIKTKRTQEILGCTFEEFKVYIESEFVEGMLWDNFGMRGWHVDHIKPLSNHYSNLQPLWAKDNLSKYNSYCG
jgi:hypothetical protein